MNKGRSQSNSRFNGRRGQYREAVDNSATRYDGYQSS